MTSKADQAQAIEHLSDYIGNATTNRDGQPVLYFVVRSVARSGMSRVMSVHVVDRTSSSVIGISHLVARAGIGTRAPEGVRVHGCGMDMRFAVADDIARLLSIGTGNDIAVREI